MKKIDWLESFAEEQYKKQGLTKSASLNKVAEQIIVDCDDYPDAKVGSLVDYQNAKYKVIDTEYEDMEGPGVVLEKVAEEDMDTEACGDGCDGSEDMKTAAADEELPEEQSEELPVEPAEEITLVEEALPAVENKKVAPSMDITGPGQKKLNDPPYHPTNYPGENVGIEVPEHFQQDADDTAAEIDRENGIDRTIVENHYTWNQNKIIDQMVTDMTGLMAPAADAEQPSEDAELPEIE